MTLEELLKDFASFHYVEGNINDDHLRLMQDSVKTYLEKIDEVDELPVAVVGNLLPLPNDYINTSDIRICVDGKILTPEEFMDSIKKNQP